MKFRGIIFDMDGTLTVPQLNFGTIRSELQLPDDGHDLVRQIAALPSARQQHAWAVIERHEEEAAVHNRMQPGARETLERFARHGIRLGILTRNSPRSIEIFLQTFQLPIEIAVGREFEPLKPAPEPVWHILRQWGLTPAECLLVGDFHHDLHAGRAAGTATCFFHNPDTESFAHLADYTVSNYAELEHLVLDDEPQR